ncbi:polyprenyl synthetase family protein [Puniceicoccus vermicola]|uniref:Polyprenyl synthetase family protein n=1 Tax=Puniceicoccus vermicola TaxID=388746 RepID=A0A7X1B1L3_9BACT|nr:polyprenyl synthetase family protein [Puniceicoccus vermicola]MBC2603956.1 polyprenyl synthetase family protein [Puniceicoccus vermicola]
MKTARQTRTLPPIFKIPSSPPSEKGMSLEEAVDYALSAEGSGFRKRLAMEAGRASGLSLAQAGDLAEGIEMFHHASLIFDDLPAMDDASERRGRACLHRVAGEGVSILAALALVNRAYTLCWKVAADFPAHSHAASRLVDLCIGELGLLTGQARDLSYSREKGPDEVRAIAGLKTGALLRLTILLPAILGGVSSHDRLLLFRVADAWGLAYQGMDDFSDMMGEAFPTGKTGNRDEKLDRPNLVLALGADQAAAAVSAALREAEENLETLGLRWGGLAEFHALLCQKEAEVCRALDAA